MIIELSGTEVHTILVVDQIDKVERSYRVRSVDSGHTGFCIRFTVSTLGIIEHN